MSKRARLGLTLLALGAFVLAWNLAVWRGAIPYLPYMWSIGETMVDDGSSLTDGAAATAGRALAGFGIGASLGVLVALVLAASREVSMVAAPYVTLAKSVPVLSLIPIFITWFGLTETARVGFVALTCFFWIVVAAAEAIRNVPRIYRWSASTLGASGAAQYTRVVLPAILPGIFGGLRNAATVSFALAVAAEFLGAQHGLGSYLIQASANFDLDKMISAVVVLTLMAVVLDQILLFVGRRGFAWTERA